MEPTTLDANAVAQRLAQKIGQLEYEAALKDTAIEKLGQELARAQARIKSHENSAAQPSTPAGGLPDEK